MARIKKPSDDEILVGAREFFTELLEDTHPQSLALTHRFEAIIIPADVYFSPRRNPVHGRVTLVDVKPMTPTVDETKLVFYRERDLTLGYGRLLMRDGDAIIATMDVDELMESIIGARVKTLADKRQAADKLGPVCLTLGEVLLPKE